MVKHLILALAFVASSAQAANLCELMGGVYDASTDSASLGVSIQKPLRQMAERYKGPNATERIRAMLVYAVAAGYADVATHRPLNDGREAVIAECRLQGIDE